MSSKVQINFLRLRRKEFDKVQVTDRKYAVLMAYLTVVVVMGLGAVFAVDWWLSEQIKVSRQNQREVTNEIEEMASIENQYILLAEKIDIITGLLENKAEKQDAIEFFTKIFADNNTTLSEVAYTDVGVITFQIASQNVFNFDQLVKAISSPAVRSLYPQVALTDVARSTGGDYTLAVSVLIEDSKQ